MVGLPARTARPCCSHAMAPAFRFRDQQGLRRTARRDARRRLPLKRSAIELLDALQEPNARWRSYLVVAAHAESHLTLAGIRSRLKLSDPRRPHARQAEPRFVSAGRIEARSAPGILRRRRGFQSWRDISACRWDDRDHGAGHAAGHRGIACTMRSGGARSRRGAGDIASARRALAAPGVTVIASAREAIHRAAKQEWIASSQTLLAMTESPTPRTPATSAPCRRMRRAAARARHRSGRPRPAA